ncbi:MAG: hypothetical protein PHT59_06865 [Candidatus Omnitrophica bacterium]|nr:hypothetical protein [Candidatus Omnitrophota bacterium]
MLALSLVIAGIALRFLPHAPNFTPVAAIALFGGAYLSDRKTALLVPLALMVASDLVLGMHNTVAFTWGGFLIITLLGSLLQKRISGLRVVSLSLVSSLVFFVVSNFGVWLMGWYPRTFAGLAECYLMAVPFLKDFTAATLLYAVALFGSYELIARAVRDTRLAKVLLQK